MGRYTLGLDVSTSAAKALLLDGAGRTIVSAGHPYPLHSPRPLWAEQDPEDWWRAGAAAVRDVLARAGVRGEEVAAVGLTGHMFGLVGLDEAGEPIRPCIMWNDQRAGGECAAITQQVGLERLIELTGNCMLPGYVAPKLLWLREREPEAYGQIRRLLFAKDYVRYRLTGELATDVSDAAGAALFDVAGRRWSAPLLEQLDVPASWLPPVFESHELTGCVSAAGASATGLKAGTPVVAGAGDQPAQAVGSGIVRPGESSLTIGTSGVVFVATSNPVSHPQGVLHNFAHAVPDTWCLMGVVMSAGGSLRWYRDTIGCWGDPGDDADLYERLMGEVEEAPAGSEGLLFLPYLTGERTPHVDPEARGGWIGLTARHGRSHLVRAVVEGITYGLRDALAMVQALHPVDGPILVSGGGARSAVWRQIQADILGRELVTAPETEGAALGVAMLAAVGAGAYASVAEAAGALIRRTGRTEPDAARVRRYEEHYAVYRGLYDTLRETNWRLSRLSA
jgi:xylulokinase